MEDDYKALVCVFLFGGMDGHDTLIPFDETSYTDYADDKVRGRMLGTYSGKGDDSRKRENLLKLNAAIDEREFGLPSNMPGLHALFNSGEAAIVANVGTLIQPTTAADLENPSFAVPKQLYSHNDQQSTWLAGEPEGARKGWGGTFADVFYDADVAVSNEFLSASVRGSTVFLSGDLVRPFQLTEKGFPEVRTLGRLAWQAERPGGGRVKYEMFKSHFRGEYSEGYSAIERDYAAAMQQSIDVGSRYSDALSGIAELGTEFPDTSLGGQLKVAAKSIAAREGLNAKRQVFFVGLGGFDTHSGHTGVLPKLQSEVDAAITSFHAAMGELGLNDDVILFTASDFGRTLSTGGDGTDHGWGNHHFVIGGSVDGGRIIGDIPPPVFGHQQDAGRGRLIPTLSVEQYAAGLGAWFGLSEDQLKAALPGLNADGLNLTK